MEERTETTHRLFAGCPLPPEASHKVHAWARAHLGQSGARVVPQDQLHITLMFFARVNEEEAAALAMLTELVEWEPLCLETGKLGQYGRSALGLDLVADGKASERLDDRLGRTVFGAPIDYYQELWREPLAQMSQFMATPEQEKRHRRHRQSQPLRLHVTVARTRQDARLNLAGIPHPTVSFSADRFCLYESHLSSAGARYEVVASSGRV